MDIALHTKGLYLRAHQGHRYGNPQAVSSLPVMQRIRLTNMDLRAKYQYARDELKAAEMLQRKISGLKRSDPMVHLKAIFIFYSFVEAQEKYLTLFHTMPNFNNSEEGTF